MKTTKDGKFLTTVPVFAWWLSDKIEERHRKKRAKYGVCLLYTSPSPRD